LWFFIWADVLHYLSDSSSTLMCDRVPLKTILMQDLSCCGSRVMCGYILGSICAAMDWDRSRRVFSLASMPTIVPLFRTLNHRIPAWCLFKMAAMETRPCLSSARLFFSSTLSLSCSGCSLILILQPYFYSS